MRNNLLHILFITLSLSVFSSCKYFQPEEEGDDVPIARVYDEYLYYSEVKGLVKSIDSPKDSAQIIKNFVDDWIKRKLILKQAENNLPAEKQNVDQQVADYRTSLMIYLYESELVRQKLDTVVEIEKIVEYYNEFQANFELRQDVVQFYYIKLTTEAPKLNLARKWLVSELEGDRQKLLDYCFQYADDFAVSDTLWFEVDRVVKEIPIEPNGLKELVGTNRLGEVSDSNFVFLLIVNDYKRKGELAPLNYVKEDISKLITNKRKIGLVNSAYESIYQEGLNSGSFEIYKVNP